MKKIIYISVPLLGILYYFSSDLITATKNTEMNTRNVEVYYVNNNTNDTANKRQESSANYPKKGGVIDDVCYKENSKSLQSKLRKFSKTINDYDLPHHSKELIVQNIGMSLMNHRKVVARFDFNYSDLLAMKGMPEIMKPELKSKFYSLYFKNNYEGIYSLIESEELHVRHIFNGKSLLSGIISLDKNIDVEVVERLISLGLNPNFSDLVVITTENRSLNMISSVHKHVNTPIEQVWFNNYHYYSLAMVAAENLNDELVQYWFNLGASLDPKEDDYTVLDVLPIPKNGQELKSAISIFSLIAENSISPYKLNSLDKVKTWLPPEVLLHYSDYFQHQENLLDHKLSELSVLINTKSNSELIASIGLIKSAINCHSSVQGLNSTLSNSTLKQDISSADDLIRSFSEKLQSLNELQQNGIIKMIEFYNSQDWDGYLLSVNFLSEEFQDDSFKKLAISQMIQARTPFKYIKGLLQDGVELPEETIFILVNNDDVQLAEELLLYGLNIYAKNEKNQSIFQKTEELSRAPSMKLFLEPYL